MEVGSSSLPGTTGATREFGGLAQLARALAWHARGHRFDSDILHTVDLFPHTIFDMLDKQDCSRYNYDEDPGLM